MLKSESKGIEYIFSICGLIVFRIASNKRSFVYVQCAHYSDYIEMLNRNFMANKKSIVEIRWKIKRNIDNTTKQSSEKSDAYNELSVCKEADIVMEKHMFLCRCFTVITIAIESRPTSLLVGHNSFALSSRLYSIYL